MASRRKSSMSNEALNALHSMVAGSTGILLEVPCRGDVGGAELAVNATNGNLPCQKLSIGTRPRKLAPSSVLLKSTAGAMVELIKTAPASAFRRHPYVIGEDIFINLQLSR